jgi:hypothetical protein
MLKSRDTAAALVNLDNALRPLPQALRRPNASCQSLLPARQVPRGDGRLHLFFEKAYPGLDFRVEAESAADFYYRGIGKQQAGDTTYPSALAFARRFRYYPSKSTYHKGGYSRGDPAGLSSFSHRQAKVL